MVLRKMSTLHLWLTAALVAGLDLRRELRGSSVNLAAVQVLEFMSCKLDSRWLLLVELAREQGLSCLEEEIVAPALEKE